MLDLVAHGTCIVQEHSHEYKINQTLFRHTGRQIGLLVIVLDSLPSGHGVKFSLVFMFCSCAPCFAPTVSLPS